MREIQKFEYLENRRKLLDEIKSFYLLIKDYHLLIKKNS